MHPSTFPPPPPRGATAVDAAGPVGTPPALAPASVVVAPAHGAHVVAIAVAVRDLPRERPLPPLAVTRLLPHVVELDDLLRRLGPADRASHAVEHLPVQGHRPLEEGYLVRIPPLDDGVGTAEGGRQIPQCGRLLDGIVARRCLVPERS